MRKVETTIYDYTECYNYELQCAFNIAYEYLERVKEDD